MTHSQPDQPGPRVAPAHDHGLNEPCTVDCPGNPGNPDYRETRLDQPDSEGP